MRTTQFIGLTDKCRKQVEGLTAVSLVRGWETFGMFDEPIPLDCYYTEDGKFRAVEYVIAAPWSSGPMILTGLMTPNGPSEFNWKEAASREECPNEVDAEKGLYYV